MKIPVQCLILQIHRAVIKIGSNGNWDLTGYFFYGTGRWGSGRVRVGLKLRLKSRAIVVPEELNVLLHLADAIKIECTLMSKAYTSSCVSVICRNLVNM